jgi:NADH dehydrogenase
MSTQDTQDQDATNPASPVTGRIFLTGGTGFVGSALRQALEGRPLRVLVRNWQDAEAIRSPMVEVVVGDVARPESLRGVMDGCEAVIHLVAVIAEVGGATFDAVIRRGTINTVAEANHAGVRRFLHMSALGARNDPRFGYFEAKWQAEQAVTRSQIPWTLFRPSVIFGPGDEFITTLAGLVRRAPVIPVVGSGETLFQPVSIQDVTAAYVRALDDPSTAYQTYALGGGAVYTYEAMIDVIAHRIGVSKPKIHVPVGLMKIVVGVTKPLPRSLRPPVTMEQLKMLAIDNATNASATSTLIGRQPMRLEDGLDYLARG